MEEEIYEPQEIQGIKGAMDDESEYTAAVLQAQCLALNEVVENLGNTLCDETCSLYDWHIEEIERLFNAISHGCRSLLTLENTRRRAFLNLLNDLTLAVKKANSFLLCKSRKLRPNRELLRNLRRANDAYGGALFRR